MKKQMTYIEQVRDLMSDNQARRMAEAWRELGQNPGDAKRYIYEAIAELVDNGELLRDWHEDGTPFYKLSSS